MKVARFNYVPVVKAGYHRQGLIVMALIRIPCVVKCREFFLPGIKGEKEREGSKEWDQFMTRLPPIHSS